MIERAVTAVARLILLAYPRAFRRAYGQDLVEVVGDLSRHGLPGRRPRWLIASGALLTMFRNGIAERWDPTPMNTFPARPRPPRGSRGPMFSTLRQDVAFTFRSMMKRPVLAALTLGMLAFGIAANTTVFTLYNAIFLRPLPFPEPERLVDLDETAPDWGLEYVGIAYPDFEAWNEGNSTFDSMAVFDTQSFNLAGEESADRVRAALVTADMLSVLGIEPALGRGFAADDHVEGAEVTVLLSDQAWRERFGASRDVLGTTLSLDGNVATVIGVLPPEAVFPPNVDVWAPLAMLGYCCEPGQNTGSWWLSGIGRLHEGATVEQALADLRAAHAPLVEELGSARATATPRIEPLVERYLGGTRPIMRIMLAAVGLLLVITCANVGGLLLAQSTARGREVGIRMALGAGRGRILRQVLTESVVLGLAGGAVGLLLASVALRQIVALIPPANVAWLDFGFDARVFAFAATTSIAAAVLFGLVPAIAASSKAPQTALQEASVKASGGRGARRALSTLVVVEVALAVVLLVGAGLLVGAIGALNDVDPGFRGDALVFSASLPVLDYPDHAARLDFIDRVEQRLAASSGVQIAGATSAAPLGGHTGNFFAAEDTILDEDDSPVVLTRWASPSYFEAVGIELLHGRIFDETDGVAAREALDRNLADEDTDNDEELRTVVVVNETFARTFWGQTDVVGRTVRSGNTTYEVIGVTRDTKHYGLDQEMRPGVFIPIRYASPTAATFAIRGGTDPTALVPVAREAIRAVDARVPIFGQQSLGDALYDSTWQRRLSTAMIAIFGVAALVLSLAGLHGTVSFSVGQRTREIGIRMALGAPRQRVVRGVIGQGLVLTGIGLATGLILAVAGAGFLSSVLFGVSAYDLAPYLLVGIVLTLTTVAATLLPARRAAGTNLTEALRQD
jgi:predicted permease